MKSPSRHSQRCFSPYVLAVTKIPECDLRHLTEHRIFPAPRGCSGWNKIKVDAWVWGLRNSPKLVARVETALGYRLGWWATAERNLTTDTKLGQARSGFVHYYSKGEAEEDGND